MNVCYCRKGLRRAQAQSEGRGRGAGAGAGGGLGAGAEVGAGMLASRDADVVPERARGMIGEGRINGQAYRPAWVAVRRGERLR